MKTLAFFLAVALIPMVALAADSKSIYVVDMQRVIDESIMGKAARNNMQEEIKTEELKLSTRKSELQRSQAALDKQSSVLSSSALQEKREGLSKQERELMRDVQDKREELSRKNGVEISRIVKEIDAIVEQLAKNKQYEFVIEKDRELVLFVKPDYDLTEQVIEALNKKKMDF
ncbi:MAG: OmpH family outer membrane protein [Oligoflexia bacterium]|nr:OmpH family outer membrane protein [Oligoflexia bacterium]